MPFSVMVSLIETMVAGMMYACCSMAGSGGASNDVHTVLLACVFPSYNSMVAKNYKRNILFLFSNGTFFFDST